MKHWNALKAKITERGLTYCMSAEELAQKGIDQDPLMWAYVELLPRLINRHGMEIMLLPDGECPICLHNEDTLIEEVADASALRFGKRQ